MTSDIDRTQDPATGQPATFDGITDEGGLSRDGQAAAPGTALDLRDTGAAARPGPDASAPATDHPMMESGLVGAGGDRPAAMPKAGAGGDAMAEAEATDGEDDRDDPASADRPPLSDAPPAAPVWSSGDAAAHPAPAARTAASAPARRGGFAPLFLGGIVAAGLGAGAAWWAVPHLPAAWQPVSAAPAVDSAALTEQARAAAAQAARDEVTAQAAAVEQRSVAAAQAAATAAAEAALTSSAASLSGQNDQLLAQAREAASAAGADAARKLIAEAPATAQPDGNLAATLAAQAEQLAALDAKIAALESQPAPDLAPLTAQVEALAARPAADPAQITRVIELAAQAEAAQARIIAAADEADARLAAAEAQATELQDAAADAARRAQSAAAAAALGTAIQTGGDRDAALAQLADAGVQTPAALTVPVVPLDTLIAEFDDAARNAVAADRKARARSGEGNAFWNLIRSQVGARSVAPREGTDADAVLSRAGEAVERGDIPAALAEIDALPEAARPEMADWTAKARAYADAQAALSGLTTPAGATDAATEPAAPTPASAPAPTPTTAPAPTPSPAQPAAAGDTSPAAAAHAAPSN